MPITALYAALLAPLFVFLAVQVIRRRRGARVALGDGGDKQLLRRMRVHANFAEYVPFSLLLMGFAESLSTYPLLLHAMGIVLLAGRLSHAYGVSQPAEVFGFRVAGMVCTFTIMAVAALACLVSSLMTFAAG